MSRLEEILAALRAKPSSPETRISLVLLYACVKHMEMASKLMGLEVPSPAISRIMTDTGIATVDTVAKATGADAISLATEYSSYLTAGMRDLQDSE